MCGVRPISCQGNLLLTAEGHLKVADFGLSKMFAGAQLGHYQMTGVTGTLRYMAPEVPLNPKP